MRLTKKTKVVLFALLILLNFIFRYLPELHEVGSDSFFIHSMANSISEFGYAKWVFSPLSFFGIYPYSYASAVQFILSGLAQTSNIKMESIIFTFTILIGIFTVFTSYLLAKSIFDDDIFKFFISFIYSTSSAVLTYTTWTVPGRGLFLVLLPLGIFFVLKIKHHHKYILFATIYSILLYSVHHLFYFFVILIVSFFIIYLCHNSIFKAFQVNNINNNLIIIGIITAFLLMYSIPFFTGKFSDTSRYVPVYLSYIRYMGFISILAIGGLFYTIFKNNKTFNEWFLILSSIILTTFIYKTTYLKWFIVSIAVVFAGFGVLNVLTLIKKKSVPLCVIFFIFIIIISFSSYYHFLSLYGLTNDKNLDMNEEIINAGMWSEENINGVIISNNYFEGLKMVAYSDTTHFLSGSIILDQIYGLIQHDMSLFERQSVLSEKFYRGSYIGGIPDEDNWAHINRLVISPTSFNISYIMEDTSAFKSIIWNHSPEPSLLISSAHLNGWAIYDNGNIKIWTL